MRGEIAEDGAKDASEAHCKPVAQIDQRRGRPGERRERKETGYQRRHACQETRKDKAEPKDVNEPVSDVGRAGAQKDEREPVKGLRLLPLQEVRPRSAAR